MYKTESPSLTDTERTMLHPHTYLFCFCLSLSFLEEEPKCCPFSNSSPAAFNTLPCTDVGSRAMRGATSHTPLRSEELKSETDVTPGDAWSLLSQNRDSKASEAGLGHAMWAQLCILQTVSHTRSHLC